MGVKGLKLGGGVLVPSKPEFASLAVAAVPGLCGSSKPLMLMGTAAADLARFDAAAAVDHRVAGRALHFLNFSFPSHQAACPRTH